MMDLPLFQESFERLFLIFAFAAVFLVASLTSLEKRFFVVCLGLAWEPSDKLLEGYSEETYSYWERQVLDFAFSDK
jgi:hypothetical protein